MTGQILACFLFSAVAVQPDAPPAGMKLRVMSFNVRWDGLDKGRNAWVNRRPVAIAMIKASAPDVIGLQEPSPAQTRDLDEALGDYVSFAGKHKRDQHITFLYRSDRFSLDTGGSFWLIEKSELSGGTRRCVWIRLVEKKTGRAFYIFNNHFDHRSRESRLQSARSLIRGILARKHDDPFIAVGDFNEVENGPAMRYLKGNVKTDDKGLSVTPETVLVDTFRSRHPTKFKVASGHGFTGRRQGVRIDYVFVSKRDRILDAQIVYHNRKGLYPSDHYPVTAEVRLVPGLKKPSADRSDSRNGAPAKSEDKRK